MEVMRLSELSKGMKFPDYDYTLSSHIIEKYLSGVEANDPLYVDDLYAKESGFGCLIVPPTTISIYVTPSRVLRTVDKAPPAGLIQAGQRYEFYRPTKRGDTVTVRASIEDLFERKGRQFVVLKGEALDPHGNRISVSYLTFIWPPQP